jgi:CO dehydrogenase maturation factor
MKIAVVGKGGSGKSTLSWLIIHYLHEQNQNVLAIDADHNMDLMTLLDAREDSLELIAER